jgi:type I restriction enzyme S subunit
VRKGDVLLTKDGANTGNAVVNPIEEQFSLLSSVALLRPSKTSLDAKFLCQFLNSPIGRAQTSGAMDGLAIRRLTLAKINELVLQLPPLDQQKKIAAILSSVDEAIEATQAVIDQLQVVKKAMMAELLTRGLPGRHTRFKQTEVGEVPETWAVLRFGDLLLAGTLNGVYKPASFYGSGTPMLDMGDLFRSEIVQERERRRVRLDQREERFVLQEGDLLFARRSLKVEGSGQCALVPALSEYPVPESSIIRARLDRSRCHPAFLLYFWNGPVGHQLRMSIARQVAVSGISAGDLVQQPVPVPPLAEQQAIAAGLDILRARAVAEENSRAALVLMKSALMSVLLTGELRVTPDARPEPA